MLKHISLLLLVLICTNSYSKAQSKKQSFILSGRVTDESTGQPLQGASIYFPEFKKGVIAGANGNYEITLPQGEHIVEVSFIGFSIYTKTVLITSNQEENFKLGHSAVENSNVTVTSFLRATSSRKTPTPINIIKKEDLFRSASTNFIDALSKTPGVSQLSTGPAVSKPIIRGLGYNRVMVLNDGVRQEGQQWGDEHGIEIDEYNVTRTEVLKVPASIIYGSEALSGVINVVSNVPVAEGAVRGNIFSNYQSNNKLQGYHIDLAGNNKGFVWGINGSSKRASDYQNKYDGYVYNSKFNELNGGAYVGIEKDWGYSHFFVSQFNQKLGMIEGERDDEGRFIKPTSNNFASPAIRFSSYAYINPVATSSDFNATNPQIPYQHIIHTKYTLDNNIKWGEGRLKANIAYQRNQRQEFGNIDDPAEKSLYFDLGTLNYSFQYLLPEKNNWKHTIGVNGMQQENKNKGVEVLIPAYKSVELGLFFYTQKRAGNLTMSGGARIDKKGIEFNDLVENTLQKKDYGAMAGSFGMTYEAGNDLIFKLNIARGYRAPNLSELGSNGAHEGTNRYEYGNTNLKSEKSLQLDLGAEWSSEHVSFAGSVFYNQVTDYIFYQKLLGNSGADSIIVNEDGEEFFAFAYKQQNANLMGAEFNLDIHPHPIDGLHIENTFSYVKGSFAEAIDGSKNLPNIPSLRWISEFRYEFKNKSKNFKNSYVTMQLDNVATQNDPFTGYNTETRTPGYHLLNIGLGTQYTKKGKQLFSIALTAQNITDVAYQNHLSRLKYTAENMATGRMGVFNMGRNYSLKVNVPLKFD
jgi:iron complex outermembrane receptor protein